MVTPGNMAMPFFGLSTDKKPVGEYNGSLFMEMDTGRIFVWDAENQVWINLMADDEEE